MKTMIKFRELKPEELEVRKSEKKDGKVSLLIYKDSRTDMKILDETVGSENWCVEYKREGDTLLCGLGIYSEKHNRFLYKWAAGSESNFEAVKGEQSDALKRAGFVWGIGRALYTVPKIYVPEESTKGKLSVGELEYNDDGSRITKVTVLCNGERIYPSPKKDGKDTYKLRSNSPSESNSELLKDFCTEKKQEEGVDKKVLLKFYNFYADKADEFQVFNPSKLYNKWVENER